MQMLNAIGWLESKLRKNFVIYIILAAAGIAAYANSITVPFVLDDFGSISNNYAVHSLFDFPAMWKFYANRIVVYFSFSINYFIHDNGVYGYHVVNTAIHILNGAIVYKIMFSILELPYFRTSLVSRYSKAVSLITALLFICHPMQVNAVTYIVQRTASLAACFYFLAILNFIKFRTGDKARHFLLVLLFTILAMFTKENTITIPFMLLILEFLFFMKDGRTTWKKRLFIFFILFLTVPIIPGTSLLFKGFSVSDPNATFKASTNMDRMQYFYTELNVIILYLKLMFIPDKQNFDYSNDFPNSITIWQNYSYVSFIILLFIAAFAIKTIKRNRLVSLGIIWFFLGIAVESSFISIKDVYFEHRLYFSCAGFAMFIIGMIFYRRKPERISATKREGSAKTRKYLVKRPFALLLAIAVIFTLTYTGLTIKRNYIYSDSIRLWTDVVLRAPKSDRAHSVLATSYLNAYSESLKNTEYLDMAEKEFKLAISMNPSNSTAHCNLSKVYYLTGEYEKCIDEAKQTLRLTKSAYADHNMALAYKKLHRNTEALQALLEGYRTDNRSLFIIRTLADTYYEDKDYKNAKFYYEEYLKYSRNSDNKDVRDKIAGMPAES
ncbi:MAG: hypothetical protein HGA22_06045 [Clostridiales bacterium]|nr:hypothetical protein [Clostridiales bacterium]